MCLKLPVKSLMHSVFLLIARNRKRRENNLHNAPSKSLPVISILIGELSNCYDHF